MMIRLNAKISAMKTDMSPIFEIDKNGIYTKISLVK